MRTRGPAILTIEYHVIISSHMQRRPPERNRPSRRPDDLEPVWRALANATRREILDLLSEGPLPTGELADAVPNLSRFAVMQHLRVLEEGGLVIRRKDGRRTVNHLNAAPIQLIHDRWVSRWWT